MKQVIPTALLWFNAIGCGVMAGVYFTFSTFVMTALARTSPAAGIAAMNSINLVIVRSLFMPLFMATTLSAAALAVLALLRWSEPGALAMLLGGALYVLGMFIVTIIFNVPLNDALAAADPGSAAGRDLEDLSSGLDAVEPRPDRGVDPVDDALHCGHRRAIAK